MKRAWVLAIGGVAVAGAFAAGALGARGRVEEGQAEAPIRAPREVDAIAANAERMVEEGRAIFRFDTFGDEQFWAGRLKLHRAIAGASRGGIGPGLSPKTALAVGLKVDVDALPAELVGKLRRNEVDLDDPATTIALLRLNAVVGVCGHVDEGGGLAAVGVECAFCHSTVDDSFAPGIGKRLDGYPNRDLNVGAVISLAPDLSYFTELLRVDERTVRRVLAAWGPGKFDAALPLDGKGFQPDGRSAATLIPPAFGLAGVNLATWTGWGSVTHWNALVANLEMHGQGTFVDERLDDPIRFPIAAREGLGHVHHRPDLVTERLPALHFYQLAIPAPRPPSGSYDVAAAQRGEALFDGRARCATCHVPPLYTEPGANFHRPEEIGIDAFQANRSPTGRYRTAPLKGLWAHQKGGFYHDGRFPTLADVVSHYDRFFRLGLPAGEARDLIEYLKSL